jgi:hypothetical protein
MLESHTFLKRFCLARQRALVFGLLFSFRSVVLLPRSLTITLKLG